MKLKTTFIKKRCLEALDIISINRKQRGGYEESNFYSHVNIDDYNLLKDTLQEQLAEPGTVNLVFNFSMDMYNSDEFQKFYEEFNQEINEMNRKHIKENK